MRRIPVIAVVGALVLVLAALPASAAVRPTKAQIKRNTAALKERLRDKPTARRAPAVALRPGRGRALAAQSLGTCLAHANFGYYVWVPNVTMFWGNAATCNTAVPVFVIVQTDMVAPNGIHNLEVAEGVNTAGLGGRADGPGGTWNMFNTVTYSVAPPFRLVVTGPGSCFGSGTTLVTCSYNAVIPTLATS
jgi:hypothetical protein